MCRSTNMRMKRVEMIKKEKNITTHPMVFVFITKAKNRKLNLLHYHLAAAAIATVTSKKC